MAPADVVVISTGAANLASVFAGLRRAGAAPRLCESPADIETSSFAVLPGVGAFGAAMQQLNAAGYTSTLRARLADPSRATLCVCLGLQLLSESSDETPGVRGLGVLPVHVRRFPAEVRAPQFGWNRVHGAARGAIPTGFAYFANSFYVAPPLTEWDIATAEHGVTFVAAASRGRQLACQFHPELSGAWGAALLRQWLSGEPTTC